jgi:hypothetical protein
MLEKHIKLKLKKAISRLEGGVQLFPSRILSLLQNNI